MEETLLTATDELFKNSELTIDFDAHSPGHYVWNVFNFIINGTKYTVTRNELEAFIKKLSEGKL